MRPYSELEGLAEIYLEDSFVLDIVADPTEVWLRVDFVLTSRHPAYVPPRPNEYYCIRRGTLHFREVHHLDWTYANEPPAVDATGELDYGGFDVYQWEGSHHRLRGGWGTLDIDCAGVEVRLDPGVP